MNEENIYIAPSTTDVEGFARWCSKRWRQAFADMRQEMRPATSNWASLLGHRCLRHIFYARTGAAREQFTPETQMIFESGNMIERDTVSFLRSNLDLEWVRSQQSVPKDEYNIGAKIDGGFRGIRNTSDPFILAEVKRVNNHQWAKITDGDIQGIHDMLDAAWWVAKYPTQGAIYLHYFQEPGLIFILREPSSGACKFIPMPLDAPITRQLWEEAAEKARTINAAVESGEPPDRIVYSKQICSMCPFVATSCFPGKAHEGAEILTHPDLVTATVELFELEKVAKKASDRRAWLREIILQTGRDHVIIGDIAEAKVRKSGSGKSVRITPLKTGGLFFGDSDE